MLEHDKRHAAPQLTTRAIAVVNGEVPAAEWGDHHSVRRIFSIKRGKLYDLDRHGFVRSVSLRRPGQKFSKRLWHLQSIRDYLKSLLRT